MPADSRWPVSARTGPWCAETVAWMRSHDLVTALRCNLPQSGAFWPLTAKGRQDPVWPKNRPPEFQATPGRDVFISYASHDKAVAESACKALESAGLVCWIAPRDVIPGESFAGAIVHAIDATKVIVLVLSEHSAASQHVLREVERASSKRHPVIAFRIDLAPMPADFEYFLNTSQWLDASAIGVKHALPKLVDAVKSALTQPLAAIHVYTGPYCLGKRKIAEERRPRRIGAPCDSRCHIRCGKQVLGSLNARRQ